MKVIGLTGGIGSGKSTAARILGELGADVLDADRLGHESYGPGTEGWRRITDAFGPEVVAPDGTIDRKRLGAIVFGDPAKLRSLNGLIHPLIAARAAEIIRAKREAHSHQPIVLEAAVLIEARWDSLVDEVWVITANRDAVVDRVGRQRGLDAAAVDSRRESQLPDEERCRNAAVVIDNSGTLEELRAKLERLWRERRMTRVA